MKMGGQRHPSDVSPRKKERQDALGGPQSRFRRYDEEKKKILPPSSQIQPAENQKNLPNDWIG
jgi:hypothetical protein